MNLRTIAVIVMLVTFCSAPALGATKYIDSSPELSAAIAGTNEFTPGQDATISIVIRNSGINTFKFVNSGTIERDDLPNTAKLVTVWLAPGTAPLTVKTDPQQVGDIKGGEMAMAKISARIANDAAAGMYDLPLHLQYRYLAQSLQDASDSMQFVYATVDQTVSLTITIRPQVNIEVLDAVPETLNVGTEGYLDIRIRNNGSEDGKKATVKITRNGASPVIPTDHSVFVGDFAGGSTITCRYKVAVSSDAEEQTYPVDVVVTYENDEGAIVTSAPVTIGIPVGGKIGFAVASAPVMVSAGSKGVVTVEYRNAGATTAYKTQARISAVDPFVSDDNTAYLGDLKPGESATARYDLGVSRSAAPGAYALDSEVRYLDVLDNSQISGTIKVPVQVKAPSGPDNPVSDPLVVCLLAAVAIGAGYYVLVMRKKK